MKTHMRTVDRSALIAGATGVGSVGAAMFGVLGAILGILAGFGVGYWAEVASAKTNRSRQQTEPRKTHA